MLTKDQCALKTSSTVVARGDTSSPPKAEYFIYITDLGLLPTAREPCGCWHSLDGGTWVQVMVVRVVIYLTANESGLRILGLSSLWENRCEHVEPQARLLV